MSKLLLIILFSISCLAVFANTCIECETTFWPKEGDNGLRCSDCATKKAFRDLRQSIKAAEEKENQRKRREQERIEAQERRETQKWSEINSEYIGWAFIVKDTEYKKDKYRFMFIYEKDGKVVYGKDPDGRHAKITNIWFDVNPFDLVYFPKANARDLIFIGISDGSNMYCLRNVRVSYKGSSKMSVKITPAAKGIRVSAAPGKWIDHDDNEHLWDVFIPNPVDPQRPYVADVTVLSK